MPTCWRRPSLSACTGLKGVDSFGVPGASAVYCKTHVGVQATDVSILEAATPDRRCCREWQVNAAGGAGGPEGCGHPPRWVAVCWVGGMGRACARHGNRWCQAVARRWARAGGWCRVRRFHVRTACGLRGHAIGICAQPVGWACAMCWMLVGGASGQQGHLTHGRNVEQ